jgi:hypothetical protein
MKKLFFAAILAVIAAPVFAERNPLALDFIPVEPCRIFDSRLAPAEKLPFNTILEQQVAFRLTSCGIGFHTQTSVRAVLVTYTIVDPDADGHLKTWGVDFGHLPYGTTMTFSKGQTVTITTVTKVTQPFPGAFDTRNGRILYHAFAHTPGGFHLVIDVAGIYVE